MQQVAGLGPHDPTQVGPYRLFGRLGEGGQGVVYLSEDGQGRQVAVKLLRDAEPSSLRLLAREVAAARRVAPFCTAQVLDANLDAHPAYVVSEYVPGPTLQQRVREQGPLTGPALDRLAVATVTALMAIHRAHLVHRDIKPSNVVLGPDGPRLLDFGIVRDLSAGSGTFTAFGYGTPLYSAPERLNGRPAGPASDIFAWACMLAFAATGRAPFEGGTLAEVMYRIVQAEPDLSGVPAELAEILLPCLAKNPDARPATTDLLTRLVGPQRQPDIQPSPAAHPWSSFPATASAAALSPPATWMSPPADAAAAPVAPQAAAGRSSSRLGRLMALLAAVLLVIGGAAGWLLSRSGDDGRASGGSGSAGPAVSGRTSAVSVPASGGSAASPSLSAPGTRASGPGAGFDGVWVGAMAQPLGATPTWTWKVTVSGDAASFEDVTDDCHNSGTVRRRTATELQFALTLVNVDNTLCARHGTTRLTLQGTSQLQAFWQDSDSALNTASGELSRQ